MKAFVLSIPKSGTYLVAEILKRLGYSQSFHISTHDYMNLAADLEELREDPDMHRHQHLMTDSLSMVHFNQFAVGHIPFSEYTAMSLLGWTKIFAYRNMKDVVISAVRYYGKIKNLRTKEVDKGELFKSLPMGEEKILLWLELWGVEFANLSFDMMGWMKEPQVLSIKFENLTGANGEDRQVASARQIALHCGKPISDEAALRIVKEATATKTVTSTDKHSNHMDYWTQTIDDKYHECGFREARSHMGLWV